MLRPARLSSGSRPSAWSALRPLPERRLSAQTPPTGRPSACRHRRPFVANASRAADARRHPARRVRPLPRQQRPALYHLDVRVDPEKKSISGKNTIRFRMLKDDTRIQLDLYANLDVDKILLGDDAAEVRARAQRGLRRLSRDAEGRPRRTPSTSTTRARRTRRGRFGGIAFRKDPAGQHWINTACEGEGASIWWPNKDQWRDEVESDGDQRRRSPTTWSTSRTASSSARPTSATATRAGTGWSSTRSTTTTCR